MKLPYIELLYLSSSSFKQRIAEVYNLVWKTKGGSSEINRLIQQIIEDFYIKDTDDTRDYLAYLVSTNPEYILNGYHIHYGSMKGLEKAIPDAMLNVFVFRKMTRVEWNKLWDKITEKKDELGLLNIALKPENRTRPFNDIDRALIIFTHKRAGETFAMITSKRVELGLPLGLSMAAIQQLYYRLKSMIESQ